MILPKKLMVSTSTMHNFPSPSRINHAGEIFVRDGDAEEALRKVPERRVSLFGSDADEKAKGKKESWLRVVLVRRKDAKDKQGENTLNFPGIESILENMQCFTCGSIGEDTEDGKKSKRFLPTLSVSKKDGKTSDDSKKEKSDSKHQSNTSKYKNPTNPEQKTRWFQKKKQGDEPSQSDQYDIWAAIMPASFGGPEADADSKRNEKKRKLQWFRLATKVKQENKAAPMEDESKGIKFLDFSRLFTCQQDTTNQDGMDEAETSVVSSYSSPDSNGDTGNKGKKQEKKSKLHWFRLSSKEKQEQKESLAEEPKSFDFNEFSSMITALVHREAEQSQNKSASAHDGSKQDESKEDGAHTTQGTDPDTEISLALWYDRLKSEGEGYIRFVTGSDPAERDPATNSTNNRASPRQEEGSLDGTVVSNGSASTTTWATEFSSYEVPSLLQEMKFIAGFGMSSKKARRQSKSSPSQEDEKFLLQKIAIDPSYRKNAHSGKQNTLTLQTLDKEGAPHDHGFKVI